METLVKRPTSSFEQVSTVKNTQSFPTLDPDMPKLGRMSVPQLKLFLQTSFNEIYADQAQFAGGTAGDVLTKLSDDDYDYGWSTPAGGGGSGVSVFTATVGVTGSGADFECDGTADDVQWQAACNAVNSAGGGTVYGMHGLYNFTAEVTVWSNTQVCGSGRGATNINAKTIPTSIYVFAFTTDYPNPGNEDITFRDMSILGMFTHGSFASGSFGVNPSRNGIRASNAKRVLIDNIYFEECANATTIGLNQYFADLGGRNIQQVTFRNNYCYRCLGGLQGYSQESIIWDGNQFEYIADDPMAFLLAEDIDSGTSKAIAVNNIVQHGRWDNDNGIEALGTLFKIDGGPWGPTMIDTVIVAHNFAEDLDFGIYVNSFNKFIAHDNIINVTNRSGMYIIYNGTEMNIHNNMIFNPNTQGGGAQGGIFMTFPTGGASGRTIVHDNQIYGENNGGKQGIQCQGESRNVHIYNNFLENMSDFAIYLETVTGGSVRNNNFNGTFSTCIRVGGSNILVEGNDLLSATYTTDIALGTFTNSVIGKNYGVTDWRTVTGVTGTNVKFPLTFCNAAGGSFFFGSMPAASANLGREYTFVKTDTSLNTVQFLLTGTDTFPGGATSFFLRTPGETVTFKARDLGGGLYEWTTIYNAPKIYTTTVNGTTVYTVTHNLNRYPNIQVNDTSTGANIPFNASAGTPYTTGYTLASVGLTSFQITLPSGAVTYRITCI